MKDRNPSIDDIICLAKSKNFKVDTDIIKKAYLYAKDKHKNQKRKSGEPFIIHPLNVAYIVAGMGLDSSTISAALLHDVVEDTDAVYENIEKIFSKEIAEIVEGVTKIVEAFNSIEERQVENYKKLFIAMEKDIRVILLKIADRLHNVKTLKYLPREKQKYIAKETIDIYAPIANKLGMFEIKNELEKYAFKYLKPKQYRKIYIEMKKFEKTYNINFNKIKKQIKQLCEKNKIASKIFIEKKPIYSIYKKIIENQESMDEIKDLISIRVVVSDKTQCYIMMGILMEQYQFIPSTFKDYISIPRNNMYQALQSLLIDKEGTIFKLKICDCFMNYISKNGILAYLNSTKVNEKIILEEKLIGIKNTLELENYLKSPKVFLQTLKNELFEEEVYVFTPEGKLVILPKGAVVIDFAYKLSEKIGDFMVGAKVNGEEASIFKKLTDGDIVEILLDRKFKTKNSELFYLNSTDLDLINKVKTAKAKNAIIKNIYLRKKGREKKLFNKKVFLKLIVYDSEDLVLNLAKKMQEMDINILGVNTEYIGKSKIQVNMEMEIFDLEKISSIKKMLNEINGKSTMIFN